MVFEDKELELNTKISIGYLLDDICTMNDANILEFIVKLDKQVAEHDFTMDLIISLIDGMSGEFKSGDLIKIRSALTNIKIKEGTQCSL